MKKNILITGATSGIGYAIAKDLLSKGHRLIITGRNEMSAKKAVDELKIATKSEDIDYILCDMSQSDAVFELTNKVKQKFEKLDVLINNAGTLHGRRAETNDGYESHLAINHILPALLSTQLKPLLMKSNDARIVFLTTMGHRFSKVNLDDLQSKKRFYGFEAYGMSKLMHLMWNYAMAEEWMEDGIKVFAADPGGAKTSMTNKMDASYMPFPFKLFLPLMKLTVGGSPEKAAQSAINLATDEQFEKMTAIYLNYKGKVIKSSKYSYNKDIQSKVKDLTLKWLQDLDKKMSTAL
ncbi:SDR family NAD(P)-dependent oxidoreductase [Aquiflexum lacus]|uniref:SDR family NAD(P)-dependent oxidoreductase n=1 Tax=Aquiflexum lacus TaxID=2483805 RepID=UPI0018941098|nr:SDR family NAD(P)-dependent oxidoreductase [Aquiflexum lacus]